MLSALISSERSYPAPGTLFKTHGTTPKSRTSLTLLGFKDFSPPSLGTFQLSLTVLYAIGFVTYLRLEVDVPHLHASSPRDATLPLSNPCHYIYETITLYGRSFQITSTQQHRTKRQPPHWYLHYCKPFRMP